MRRDRAEIAPRFRRNVRAEIDAEVKKEFRERTANGQKVHVFAMAETGAEELEEGHADYHKRCVPRVNATVATVDADVLRVTPARMLPRCCGPPAAARAFARAKFSTWRRW